MDKYLDSMSPEKQKFIKKFIDEQKPDDPKKALPFIMNYVAMAKQNNISFTKEEIIFLYNLYSTSFSEEEKSKLNKIFDTLK